MMALLILVLLTVALFAGSTAAFITLAVFALVALTAGE